MVDFLCISKAKEDPGSRMVSSKSGSRQCMDIAPVNVSEKALERIALMDCGILGMGTVLEIGQFLLKVAALEMVRRFSKVHCPFLWRGIQASQIFCCHPFKWIQKWAPFKCLLKCLQTFSKPVLALSIVAPLFDQSVDVEETSGTSGTSDDSQAANHVKQSSKGAVEEAQLVPESSMQNLLMELEKEGLILPERINQDELRRFYDAVNGDFSSFLSSIKKTINWRKKFTFLSLEQLEPWYKVVFWHGYDVKRRPCLFIRVGLAYSNMVSEDRSCLSEVVVSQIEYGVLHLVDPKEPQIIVVMDCHGLTPFHFPVQMMRSCAMLLQDHYPNRLSALFIVRLSPFARVIGQTLFQVLRPATRRKLRIEGANYKEVLTKYIEMLPSSIGGDCSCLICADIAENAEETTNIVAENMASPSSLSLPHDETDGVEYDSYDKLSKAAILGIVILLIMFSALVLRVYNVGGA
ncbi:hypothetical protein Dimus_011312 [Dionaea muscipula]